MMLLRQRLFSLNQHLLQEDGTSGTLFQSRLKYQTQHFLSKRHFKRKSFNKVVLFLFREKILKDFSRDFLLVLLFFELYKKTSSKANLFLAASASFISRHVNPNKGSLKFWQVIFFKISSGIYSSRFLMHQRYYFVLLCDKSILK